MMLLLTRSSTQAESPLTNALDQHQIPWVNLPCLRIDPPSDPTATTHALKQFNSAQHVIITSANAARSGLTSPEFDRNRPLIAIGPASRHSLIELGYTDIMIPDESSSEGLLALSVLSNPTEQPILVVTGESPRPLLSQSLIERGATVTQAFTYQRTQLTYDEDEIRTIIQHPITHVLTMSQETLSSLWNIFHDHRTWLCSRTLCVTANRQAQAVETDHFHRIKPLASPVIEHLVAYLLSTA